MHDIALIESQLRRLGLQAGMNLLVHSSLRRVGPVEGGAEAIIDCLLRLLGPDGTLMMSTVSGNVNREQPVFHVQETPSTVGTLGNVFRRRPGAIRSLHPVHSVVAMGPKAEFFTAGHLEARTPWSPDSPYGKLMRNHGHILFLGTNFTCNTCIHALEIEARVPGLHTEETQPCTSATTRANGMPSNTTGMPPKKTPTSTWNTWSPTPADSSSASSATASPGSATPKSSAKPSSQSSGKTPNASSGASRPAIISGNDALYFQIYLEMTRSTFRRRRPNRRPPSSRFAADRRPTRQPPSLNHARFP